MNPTDSILSSAADAAIAFFRRHEVQGASVIEPYVVRLFAALQNGHSFIYLDKADVDALSNLPNLVGNADKPLILHGRKLFLGRMWQLEHDLAVEIKQQNLKRRFTSYQMEVGLPYGFCLQVLSLGGYNTAALMGK